MRYNYIILLIACLGITSSCRTLKKSTSSSQNIEAVVKQVPTVVDLNVAPKVEKTVTWNYTLLPWGQPTFSDRKGNLIADMVKESGADILLEPQTTYTKVPFGQRTLTITGYPATYKNFRKATKEDLHAIEIVAESRGHGKVSKTSTIEKKGNIFQKIFSW